MVDFIFKRGGPKFGRRAALALIALSMIPAFVVPTGCASESAMPAATPVNDEGAQPAPMAATPAPNAAADADYHLTAGDSVNVEMFNQPEVETTQRLTANGEIRLPMLGRIALQGLTLREAEKHLEKLFKDEGYFVDPQITVSVQDYGNHYIDVLGQVRSPGRITMPPETDSIGILQAITQSGGFTRIARTDSVQVTRRSADGTTQSMVVDVRELLNARRPAEKREFQLMAGDVVFVPERVL
jgi:polysaccharide export outer membrane protein